MADDSYWAEVARQSQEPMREGELQEFRLLLELMRGNERDKKRRMLRFKVVLGSLTVVGAATSLWDWVWKIALKLGGH